MRPGQQAMTESKKELDRVDGDGDRPSRAGPCRWLRTQWWFWAAVVVLLVTAIVEGRWTLRWGVHGDWRLDPLAQTVQSTPLILGTWTAEEAVPPDPRVVEVSGARAIFMATYREPLQADAVTVYLLVGWSRDMAVHTPDACYPGAGFVMDTSPQPFSLTYGSEKGSAELPAAHLRQAEFTTAIFTKSEPTGVTRLRVFWSWHDGRGWQSPKFPRWTFGGQRPLVKLYLVAESPPGLPVHQSAALRLAQELLPILDSRLEAAFAASRATPPATPAEK